MNKQTIRFNNNGASLDVLARNGKTGISVFLRVKSPGQRAVIGCRNVFLPANEKTAQETFDRLVADAESKGWTRKTAGTGATASQFSEVPLPTALPASVPLAPKVVKAKVAEAPKAKLVSRK